MTYIKSKKLQKGDTVAIISPSWGGPSVFPKPYELGLKTLEEFGLKIKEFPSARKDADYNYNHPEFRAKDINDAYADKDVKAIFSSIGGDDSIRILPYLDLEVIKNNPKPIMGYSDNTTLLTYINQQGIITLHGPCIMAGLSQYHALEKSFQEHIKQLLLENPENYSFHPYKKFNHGYPDWGKEKNIGKIKKTIKNKGWNWLQGDSVVKGILYGGSFEVMEFMKGTKYWPKKEFWNNKILFLETSEDKPSPSNVKWMLRNYGIQGIFDQISALLIGRPRDYSEEEVKELESNILNVVKNEFKNDTLPIVSNMDFGHTDPQWIIPLGIKAEVNCKDKTFKLKEKIFED